MASAIPPELARLQIPLQKILDATNNFSEKKIIGKGDFGNVYTGKLEHDGKMIKIAARRLDRKYGHGDVEFWNEVSALSSFRGENFIVSMIGFCDENDEKVIINHHYPKGSLSLYISDPLELHVNRRLAIAMTVCVGIFDVHTKLEGDYIIHRNISSSTILLNERWMPRLSGFEFSIKHSKERRNQIVNSEAIGTQGYIDPAIEKYGGVNHKTDIYSVGVVLFELLCGRKAFEENTLLAPLAKFHYEKGTLKDVVHPDLWNKMKPKFFKCFSKAAYSCLQEDPALRPDGEELMMLLREAKSIQKDERHERVRESERIFENVLERSSPDLDLYLWKRDVIVRESESIFEDVLDRSSPDLDLWKEDERDEIVRESEPIIENVLDRSSPDLDLWKVKKWEHLRIGLTHIYSHSPLPPQVTKRSFELEIEYYDREYVSFVEQKNTDELPKRRHTVMAKMLDYEDVNVFLREVEILDSCRHPNIQSFVGFYDQGRRMMLFYEYVSNKFLDDSLNKRVRFTWGQCLKICIDVANGLDYLHNGMDDQKMVIHGDLSCAKIELDDNFGAKIVGFENSIIFHSNQSDDSIQLNELTCRAYYIDPEYENTGKPKRESDVYSFGVVMFEILGGRRLPLEVNYGNTSFLKKGPNEDSLGTFIDLANKCVAKSQMERPEIKVVIKELHKALSFHDPLRMSFDDIKLATQDFDRANCIGGGGFGLVYKGKLAHGKDNGHTTIVVKKLDKSQGQGEKQYYNELQILYEYNHENVIGLVGYSNETDEKLIVYEYASKGSLDKHLNNASLTWRNRLKICIDVATGLNFLHGGIRRQEKVIHRDIKTANILLFDDWKAKIGDFGLSLITTVSKRTNFTIDHPCGTKDYVDPMYLKSGLLTVKSDVYSLGVALFEILCGRATYTISKHRSESLLSFIKHKFEEGKQDEVVFKAIKEEIVPKSLATFLYIVYKCLDDDRQKRPTTKEVLTQLKKALKFQDENKV